MPAPLNSSSSVVFVRPDRYSDASSMSDGYVAPDAKMQNVST